MIQLHNLGLKKKSRKRVGRGVSSGVGKTCGRGEKGDGSRSGYKRRHGYIGGGVRLHLKLPTRGFTRGRFKLPQLALNLSQIDSLFKGGEILNEKTLKEKGLIPKQGKTIIKILSCGEMTKKVKIEAHHFSKTAEKKLKEKAISYTILQATGDSKKPEKKKTSKKNQLKKNQ